MPQWRKLHVKSVESLDINDMPDDFTRLMWVLLPLGLDCEGRGLDNTAWIKSKIFPLRLDITNKMIEAAMNWYTKRGMVVRYEVAGRAYFHIPTFTHYQGNTEREAASNFPAPPVTSEDTKTPDQLLTNSRLDADAEVDSDADAEKEDSPVLLLLQAWKELFPKKPQPRESTSGVVEKIKTRWKSEHFRQNWRLAMEEAARSPTLQGESWFDFRFFVRNEESYQKCLDHWMAWKDEQLVYKNKGYKPAGASPGGGSVVPF